MFEQNQDFHSHHHHHHNHHQTQQLGTTQQQQHQNDDYQQQQQQQPDQSMMSSTMATTASTSVASANNCTANMVDDDGSGGGDLYYQDRLTIVTTEMLPSSSTTTISSDANANDGYFHHSQETQQHHHQEYQLQSSSSTTGSNHHHHHHSIVDDHQNGSGNTNQTATNVPGTTLDYETLLPDQQAAIINSSDTDTDILLQDLFATPEALPNSTTNSNAMDYCNMSRADSSSSSLSQQQPPQQHQLSSLNEDISAEYPAKMKMIKSSSLDQTFDYVDSLMEDYGGNDPNNGDSSDGACHDFLTNLEVDPDPNTKVVVDQFIASTTTTMEDASASMITSSEDILQPTGNGMTDTDVVDCLVNEAWFSHQTNSRSSLGGSSSVSPPPAAQSLERSISGQLQSEPLPPEESSSGSFSAASGVGTSAHVAASTEKSAAQPEAGSPKSNDANSFRSGNDVSHSPIGKSLSATSSNSSTMANPTNSSSISANKNNSPIHQYLTNTDSEEMPRHTICPLCDNARSFCSSSSVTRHLRSVHKLAELMDTKYCYCVLCNQFQEDIGAFYDHLEHGHSIDLLKNFEMFFTKRFFNSFDEFIKWKEHELETPIGCRYERCISYDYPRSLYYKCTGIQIETSGPDEPTAKTCRVTLKFPCQNDSIRVETGDLSKLGASSSNPESSMDTNSNSPSEKENSVSLKIDNQCDARMYPCPSSVRLIIHKNRIQANYIPFHLGHVLSGTCTSNTTSAQKQSTMKRASNYGSTGGSSTKIKKQNQMVQTSSTLPAGAAINPQVQVQSFLANNNQQMVALAATSTGSAGGAGTTTVTLNQNQLASLANFQLAAATGGNKNAPTQLVHFPVVNLVGGNLVLAPAPSNVMVSGGKSVNRLQMQSSQQPKSFINVSTQSEQSGPKTFQLFNSFDSTGQTVSTSMIPTQRSLAQTAVTPMQNPPPPPPPPPPQQIQLQVRINKSNQSDAKDAYPADSSSQSMPEGLENAASTTNNAVPAAIPMANPTQSQPQSNGLVIVSLEKGMEMVQEQFRPRKENLRMVFEQLLSACFTESDFDLVETSLASISQHLQMASSSGSTNPTAPATVGTSTTAVATSSTSTTTSTVIGSKP